MKFPYLNFKILERILAKLDFKNYKILTILSYNGAKD